jgi:uncharacterized phage-associated protein
MFPDEFEAWQYGPVNREVYDHYKIYRDREISSSEGFFPRNARPEEIETIESVWREYGRYTASELVNMTHQEKPWIYAYQNGTKISNESIRNYFINNY